MTWSEESQQVRALETKEPGGRVGEGKAGMHDPFRVAQIDVVGAARGFPGRRLPKDVISTGFCPPGMV